MFRKFFHILEIIFWQKFHIQTKIPGSYLTKSEIAGLLISNRSFCSLCSVPFPKDFSENPLLKVHLCGGCLQKRPVYDLHRSLFCYEGGIRDLIHAFKYKHAFWVRHFLGEFFQSLKETFHEAQIILPIPLSKERFHKRGYNQSQLLAEIWSQILGIPFFPKILVRKKLTRFQFGLDSKEREKNLKLAFEVQDKTLIRDKILLLVDDIHTTGATLNEASRCLKKQGAKKVFAATLAVTPRHI